MSLLSALNTARTGLATSQSALEVVGNNLANAATPGYSRQTVQLTPNASAQVAPGVFIGTGVRLQAVVRQVDEALNARIRTATSDQQAAQTRQDLLTQVQSIENDLSDQGLSSQLTQFFNSWSGLAANPTDFGQRSLVISQGQSLATQIQSMRSNLVTLQQQATDQIKTTVNQADTLLGQIADLNQQIMTSEGGAGGANTLRDSRDALLDQLSHLLPITTIEHPGGNVDVLVNSVPVVLADGSRGLGMSVQADGNSLDVTVHTETNGQTLNVDTGQIGQLIASRNGDLEDAISAIDDFAGQLVNQLNILHSAGQGSQAFDGVVSNTAVYDPSVSLGSAAAGLKFPPTNGSFALNVIQKSTGQTVTRQITVNLNGTGSDTTLTDLANQINAVPGLTASVGADNKLHISADSPDFQFTFAGDTSGVLASLGVNTFFTGTGASDIAVSQTLLDNPGLLATGQGGVAGDNAAANAIAGLIDQPLDALGGGSLRQLWTQHVQDFAVRTASVTSQTQSATTVTQSLTAQRQATSGVNIDEESIDMIQYQRAYQGSARFISTVNQLMDTLLSMVQ